MIEATGGRRYYNCQCALEDVETLYNLLNNNNVRQWIVSSISGHSCAMLQKVVRNVRCSLK